MDSRISESFFNFVLDRKHLIIPGLLLLVTVLGGGLQRLSFSNDYRIFFGPENPQLKAFEQLQDTYSKTDNVLFVIEPADHRVFTRQTLAAVEALTQAAWRLPYSLRVDSITNFQYTHAQGEDLVMEDLISEPQTLSAEALARKREIATKDPLLVHRLISPEAHVTGVNVTIQLPGKSLHEVPEVAAAARELATRMAAAYPQIEIHLTGILIMNHALSSASLGDMQTLYPAMFGAVILALVLMLRSVSGTFSTLMVILMTIIGTLGITGWLGIRLSPPTTTVPIVIMTLAIADCVHLLVNFLHGLRQGMDKRAAMRESLRLNLQPIFLTTLTTAIGFLSLNFSESPPFRDLGNMTAIGVWLAFFLSVTLLPALMMLLPVKPPSRDTRGNLAMLRLAEWVIRHRQRLLWAMGALVVFLLVQIPNNRLDDRFVEYFDHTNAFRQATDFATEHLTGIYLIEYSLNSGEPGGVSEPAFLQQLEAFAEWYRAQPHVLHVSTLSDIMKRLNRNMRGDDDAWYRLPERRELAAQYLLLYEFSLPFGLNLNDQINVKRSATRFSVTLDNVSTRELLALEAQAQAWLAQHAPGMRIEGASPALMFAHIGDRNTRAMLKGTTLALVAISGILVFALRSLRIGGLSLLPNLAPIAMAFGLWGLLVGEVGLALSVVSGMTLGIVVDDTVHFLSKFLRARREQGLGVEDAVRYAFSTVGTALWVTSLVLIVGFGILAFSHFEMNAGMGLLTAITLGFALLADFLFLPPLLMLFGGKHAVDTQPVDDPVAGPAADRARAHPGTAGS